MRDAARLLLLEGAAVKPILAATSEHDFDRSTICDGWTVRDVLGHCGAALTRLATGDLHGFTPEDNERDVERRRTWQLSRVLDELYSGYEKAATAIDGAGGRLDGVGLGEWVHGGDVREALGVGRPYASEGADLAVRLLLQRSVALGKLHIDTVIDGENHVFGAGPAGGAELATDLETFVRLCGGRRPDPVRYRASGCSPADFILFT